MVVEKRLDTKVEDYLNEILSAVRGSRVTIIRGPTGCGKTTVVPVMLAREYKRIAVVEPRRIAVLSLYRRLRHRADVGYKVRFSSSPNKDAQIMLYTDGMFIRENKPFDVVVVDEVHERSLRMDVIMATCKQKMVLMSATVEVEKLRRHFNASFVEIHSSVFPLQIFYEDGPVTNYITASYMKITEILKNQQSTVKKSGHNGTGNFGPESWKGDILVFLPGEEDITELFYLVKPILSVNVHKIHSSMSDDQQLEIFAPSSSTKVIISTNICESSITIPGIRFVIDTGVVRMKIYLGFCYLVLTPISSNSAVQRAGRANREGPGTVYRLYTQDTFKSLPDFLPEIRRSDMRTATLLLMSYGFDPSSVNWPDLPSRESMKRAFLFLWECTLIKFDGNVAKSKDIEYSDRGRNDEEKRASLLIKCFRITELGREVAKLPFDVHISYLYHLCIKRGLPDSGAILASMMGLEGYNFVMNSKDGNDICFLLNIFKTYLKYKESSDDDSIRALCKENKIQVKGLETAYKIYKHVRTGEDVSGYNIHKIFSDAFKYNVSERQRNGCYVHIGTGKRFWARRTDKKIVFVDIVRISRSYGNITGLYYGLN